MRKTLESIVDEMALTIMRTAYSSVVRDTSTISTGFCDRHGELVAQGLTIADAPRLGPGRDGVDDPPSTAARSRPATS